MYAGLVLLDSVFADGLLVRDADGKPYAPDAAPTYRVLGPEGFLSAVFASAVQVGAETGLYRTSFLAAAASGFAPGTQYFVYYQWAQGGQPRGELHCFTVT